MHLEILHGRKIACQVEIPQVDRKEVPIDCVIPPGKAFWSETSGLLYVYHPNMMGGRKILVADPYINGGVETRSIKAKLTTDPFRVREKTLRIRAVIFD